MHRVLVDCLFESFSGTLYTKKIYHTMYLKLDFSFAKTSFFSNVAPLLYINSHLVRPRLAIDMYLFEQQNVYFLCTYRPSSLKGAGHRKSHPMAVKLAEPENSQYQYQNFQSRSRLDARLWLTFRAALVKSLMTEIRGMGEVKGQWHIVLHFLRT